MNSAEIGVLIVDDSALMRNLISRIVENTPGLSVVGKAMNGQFALEKIPSCQPDVIVLDIEMPVMTGLEFLKERKKRGIDIPVIMLSSLTTEGAAVTMQCLELGASDFLTKPGGSVSGDLSAVAARLVELLSSYGGQYARLKKNKYIPVYKHFVDPAALSAVARSGSFTAQPVSEAVPEPSAAFQTPIEVPQHKQPAVVQPLRESGRIEVIAIGISTGGPNALREVFRAIDPGLCQPVLVVQHMPAGFTEEFANSLNHICPLEVKEAHDGDLLKPGRILIAPGNYHMFVEHKSLAQVVRLSDAEQRNGHRPSVDVLFESVAAVYQNRALGVIMTGMGRDGAAQLAEMRRQGARTLGQDEKTSVVYGMPKVAWELGGVQKQVPLQDMAGEISTLAKEYC
ncbi:protein-glutamate methylesterase/protein-glutamine glutaminase [Treponema brennaborense]|uniref:Protein-glutamate methylesterase/protein-glutamine glutaminase n=1 Tax=Treponema brennaborense (strain DSM 12168 / CIP 105900 / DD5/3) TaxID=906968 RepID=F4LIC1_TREBD|nr:chemotaxis response regulator protein-glutamate methylesterase [Treponema brennaborense]AEE16162.1 response regulator receiver modulated CheB methylesterase [Treponema brennaborense DSM 12168]